MSTRKDLANRLTIKVLLYDSHMSWEVYDYFGGESTSVWGLTYPPSTPSDPRGIGAQLVVSNTK